MPSWILHCRRRAGGVRSGLKATQPVVSEKSHALVQCRAGTFKEEASQSLCSDCPAGKVQPETGQTNCTSCVPGRFAASAGLLECSNCPAGENADISAAKNCSICAKGDVANGLGSSFSFQNGRIFLYRRFQQLHHMPARICSGSCPLWRVQPVSFRVVSGQPRAGCV